MRYDHIQCIPNFFLFSVYFQGLFQQFLEMAPDQNSEKMIDLTSKLGKINDIEHNKSKKIYPQNQIILDCIMQG